MKKISLLAITLITSLALLAGCSQQKNYTQTIKKEAPVKEELAKKTTPTQEPTNNILGTWTVDNGDPSWPDNRYSFLKEGNNIVLTIYHKYNNQECQHGKWKVVNMDKSGKIDLSSIQGSNTAGCGDENYNPMTLWYKTDGNNFNLGRAPEDLSVILSK